MAIEDNGDRPNIESLVIMYKTLLCSRIDYGIMVIGSSSENRPKKLEAILNS
jgi:hypothetical protein